MKRITVDFHYIGDNLVEFYWMDDPNGWLNVSDEIYSELETLRDTQQNLLSGIMKSGPMAGKTTVAVQDLYETAH